MSSPSTTNISSGIYQAVIPAAGLGTRLRPLTQAFPKEMLPIGRKPVLEHILLELCAVGITRVLLIVSQSKPQIPAYFGSVYRAETDATIRCDYVMQTEQRGLGDALLYAQEWVQDESFVVAFGDCLIDAPDPGAALGRMLSTHQEQSAAATVLVETVAWEKVSRYGILAPEAPLSSPEQPFAVKDIVEKPARAEAPTNLAVAARYVFTPEIFAALQQATLDVRGELNVTDSVRALRQQGRPLWAVPLLAAEARRDIGNFESFFTAFVRMALRDPDYGETVRRMIEAEYLESDGTIRWI